jgi:hypothetical protein
MFVSEAPTPLNAAPLAGVPLELIEREIEQLAAQINAGCARWLELVAEFDRREGWGGTGCRSTAEWVAWRCALNPRSAREHVRVARALPELPAITAAFRRGELSYSKARALTRVADAHSEQDLLELARHATAAQLERIVRAARRVSTEEAGEQVRNSFVRWHWDEDGLLRLEAKLPPDDGALLLRALDSARDALYEQRLGEAEERADGSAGPLDAIEPSGSAEPPANRPQVRSPSNAEALSAMAAAALARPPTGLPGGERYQVILHVDHSTLAGDEPGASALGPGTCALGDGPGIAPETARRLACDTSLVALIEHDGQPLSVGRRTRTIPPSIRRALVARDDCCQFPGCEQRRFVDAHHIVHWAQGGETSLDNLVLLCRHHHRHVHEGGIEIALDGDGRHRFTRPDGKTIPQSPVPPELGRPPLRSAASSRSWSGSGEPMDLAACVDAAVTALAPAA